MQIHELKRATPNKKKKTVGRGGTRGKTSGRGHKGQGQHSGGAGRPAYRDMIKKIPKLRGHGKNRAQTVNASVQKPAVVTLAMLETFDTNSLVSPKILVEKGFISRKGGRIPDVKILANGDLTKKIMVIGCTASQTAIEKIQAAGGKLKA